MTLEPLAIKNPLALELAALMRLRFGNPAALSGVLAISLGLLVLVGWVLEDALARSVGPGLMAMKANTAVCFVLMGGGLVLLSTAPVGSRGRTVGRLLVCGALLIAVATAVEYVTNTDLGIDRLIFRDAAVRMGALTPGRMAPLSAASFILVGIAIVVGTKVPRLIIGLSSILLTVAVLSIFDYVFDAAVPPILIGYTSMAVTTAVGIAFLVGGVIARLGPMSPLAVLAGRSPVAVVLRRLLAVLIVVPVILSWLRLEGQRMGLYDTSYGTSLMLVAVLILGVVAILRSASWAKEIESRRAALEIERDRFFELSIDMLSVVGADGRFRRANGAWEAVLGYRPDALVGRPYLEFVHPDDLERTVAQNERHYELGERVDAFQNRYRHTDGSYRWLEWMSQLAPDGSVAFAVARDVTERKRRDDRRVRAQERLERRNEALSERALRDPLTDLHNRRFFETAITRLERRWSRMSQDKRPQVSVLIFDLDHFGLVNKQHGHQAGDAVLRVFAGLLRRRFREQDLVIRYGGEEFVVVIEGPTAVGATRIANEIRGSLEAASIDIGTGTPIRVTVSAGCAQLGEDRDTSAAMAMADVWLSQAKRAGRNQVVGL